MAEYKKDGLYGYVDVGYLCSWDKFCERNGISPY